MVKTFKTGLIKVSSRLHRFLGSDNDRHWPARVLETLEAKYHLLPRDLLRLWYVRRRTVSDKLKTESIFIYDWASAYKRNLSIREYNDLHKHPDLLLYKGHILSNGEVRIERIRNN